MYIFYTPDITESNYLLSEEESAHCIRVLRKKTGDSIQTVDGKGGWYKAEVIDTNPKKCAIKIIESSKEYGKRDFYLHMAVAPTKNIERFEWFLEKATEMGIDEITPLICYRSERTSVKTERLNKILVSAMKQSLKAYLPKLNEAVSFKNFLNVDFVGQKFIAHCQSLENSNKIHLKNLYQKKQNALILIGPEGDFTEEEIQLTLKKKNIEISLGISRLRTETAAVLATNVINLMNES